MKTINLEVELQHSFGNLYRKRHVLLLVHDSHGNVYTGAKANFYPENISRLLGGGMDEVESPITAALRELKEETGLDVKAEELHLFVEVQILAHTPEQDFNLTTYMVRLQTNSQLIADDDVSSIMKLTIPELYKLADAYEAFPLDSWYIDGDYKHTWSDYGKVYGPIHRIAADHLNELGF
jgi:8-oxo-dGTP pyrophosphatase MutT (NUDIX family)